MNTRRTAVLLRLVVCGGGNDLNRLRVEFLVKLSPDEARGGVPVLGLDRRRERFDLSRYVNRTARIRIIDETTGGWGHLKETRL